MLNPSKASESHNDPTIERCERRARAMRFGAFRVVNIFAWRETSPAKLRRAPHPIGPENDAEIAGAVQWADLVLAAWGVHGAHLDRGPTVAQDLRDSGYLLYHLGLTSAGHPRHPLYRPYSAKPELWTPEN